MRAARDELTVAADLRSKSYDVRRVDLVGEADAVIHVGADRQVLMNRTYMCVLHLVGDRVHVAPYRNQVRQLEADLATDPATFPIAIWEKPK